LIFLDVQTALIKNVNSYKSFDIMISAGMDGFKRLEEINSSVEKESNKTILELIFLPLYGNISHKEIAESVLEYDLQLCKAN